LTPSADFSLKVVLVQTEYATNIGASARALANMGGHQLILIQPRTPINSKARQGAAGAQSALQRAVIYKDWEEFLEKEGQGFRIGMTRRAGRNRKVMALSEALEQDIPQYLEESKSNPAAIFLCFGTEADGLSLEDLSHLHLGCHLPIFGEFGSLNLAQAVLLALFMVRQKYPPTEKVQQTLSETPPAFQEVYCPDNLIRQWIEGIGFDIEARSSSAYLTLKKLFTVFRPTEHERIVVDEILKQTLRKLT
tara:strand:+ start:1427 stop:2176 length:750 start_codon:yes stop_codon:yes gene_type:complete